MLRSIEVDMNIKIGKLLENYKYVKNRIVIKNINMKNISNIRLKGIHIY